MGKAKDLSGLCFGDWTVIEKTGTTPSRHSLWLCKCICGEESIALQGNLVTGKSKNCGCKKEYNTPKNNVIHHTLYRRWSNMKTRCYNENTKDYKYYGGRGIRVCDEWLDDFMKFYSWSIGHGFSDDLTIDRKNNDGNYEPNNCRWVSMKEQNQNKRNTNKRES